MEQHEVPFSRTRAGGQLFIFHVLDLGIKVNFSGKLTLFFLCPLTQGMQKNDGVLTP